MSTSKRLRDVLYIDDQLMVDPIQVREYSKTSGFGASKSREILERNARDRFICDLSDAVRECDDISDLKKAIIQILKII